MYPSFMPYFMPAPPQQQSSGMTPKEFKKFIRAYSTFQREWEEKNKQKPDDKKKEEQKKEEAKKASLSKGEILAYMWVFSPIIGLATVNMYLYCFQQIQHALKAVGAN